MLKYSADHYDEGFLLKVPSLLWLAILYGIRHYFIVGAAFLMPMDIVTLPWINMQSNAYFMLTDVPAALVLLAIGHRTPEGLQIMRTVWKNGRWLLVLSYLAGIALFAYANRETLADPDAWDFGAGLAVLVIDFACLAYLLGSGLVRDVFRDVPPAGEPSKNQASTRS